MKHLLKSATVAASIVLFGGTAVAEEITMNAVSLAPRQADIAKGFAMFVDEINAKFDGEFQINWRGGPEVMPPFGQAEAVRNGAMDMTVTSPSYYSGLVPTSTTMNLSFLRYDEIRPTGYYERMTELHAEQDLVFLGEVPATDLAFHMFLNKPVETLSDMEGLRIRTFPTLLPMLEALGAEPLVLPMGEIYTAMERGAIDGFMRGAVGWAEQFEGVVTHVVYPGVYRAGFPVLVNKAAWGELPEDLQQRIVTFVRDDLSSRIDEIWAADVAAGVEEMAAAGFTVVELSDEDAQKLRETAIDAAWAVIAEEAGAEVAAELRAMLVP
ncbi:TRAP transporter substrate-binding protein DctP [Oceanibium sediminis]|uniref:TRAP transporter substrate-binding protein DctP n=1 Tax=Oceanibium sediminis TaxID=2026339 RepID=UPI000DD4DC44|nr:TRAP transporter substrate-binding protein DctP [Oceanibium sediminis]